MVKSDGSVTDKLEKDVSAVRSFNPISGNVIAEMYFLLPKAESITYSLRSGAKNLVTFTTDDKNFYANGEKVYENYYANLYYRLRVEADTDSQKAVIKINGKKRRRSSVCRSSHLGRQPFHFQRFRNRSDFKQLLRIPQMGTRRLCSKAHRSEG